MSDEINRSNTSSTGTNTLTQAAGNSDTTWNLTYLSVSSSVPHDGAVAGKVTVYDGDTSGTALFAQHIPSPAGSVGAIVTVDIPRTAKGDFALQASPGNAMTVVFDGTGPVETIVNARFQDGLPAG